MDFSQHSGGGVVGNGGGGGGGIRGGSRSGSSSNSSSSGGPGLTSVGSRGSAVLPPSSPSTSQYMVHSPFSPKNEVVYQAPGGSPLPGGAPLGFPRSPASPLMASSIKSEPPVSPLGLDCSIPNKKGRYDGSGGSGSADWGSGAPSPSMMVDSPDPNSSNGAGGFGVPVMSPMSSSSLGDPSSPFPRSG
ncbi:unnamed protein product, partial [Meganyctiphanes norvegica]